MNKITEDVSKLTTIPVKTLDSLMDKFLYCIVDLVKETNLAGENTTNIDLDFGVLSINYNNNQLKYKFTPSSKFNQAMSDLFNKGLNSLENILESSLITKITNTYKDLI